MMDEEDGEELNFVILVDVTYIFSRVERIIINYFNLRYPAILYII